MASLSSTGSLSSTLSASTTTTTYVFQEEFSSSYSFHDSPIMQRNALNRVGVSISKNDFSIYLHDIQNEYITFDSNLNSPKNSSDDEVSQSSSVDEKELREDLIKCRRSVSVSPLSLSLSLSLQTLTNTHTHTKGTGGVLRRGIRFDKTSNVSKGSDVQEVE